MGASNSFALNNVIPGTHSLRVEGVIVPDDVGTYEVILGDGITFVGGGTRRSGIVRLGESVTFGIVVPSSTGSQASAAVGEVPTLVDEEALVRKHRRNAQD
jgi:hypothetical protein